jgi:hypothetical protein
MSFQIWCDVTKRGLEMPFSKKFKGKDQTAISMNFSQGDVASLCSPGVLLGLAVIDHGPQLLNQVICLPIPQTPASVYSGSKKMQHT